MIVRCEKTVNGECKRDCLHAYDHDSETMNYDCTIPTDCLQFYNVRCVEVVAKSATSEVEK